MAYKGQFGLEYTDIEEEESFVRLRRLNGHHTAMVKQFYPEKAYQDIMGKNWTLPEPGGTGRIGIHGMSLRYATMDDWYKEFGIEKGKFTEKEVADFYNAWKSELDRELPLSDAEILKFCRDRKKNPKKVATERKRRKRGRRTQAYEKTFHQDRNPSVIFRQLESALPSSSALDAQLLKQLARLLANTNDLLWQAELMKDGEGQVPIEDLGDFNKLHDLIIKTQRQVLQLLQQHGYDYQSRRKRKEAQTAAEVMEEFTDQAAELFDTRAVEFLCQECKTSLGYFLRHFPTIEYDFKIPKCPKCGKKISAKFEALPDEVMTL